MKFFFQILLTILTLLFITDSRAQSPFEAGNRWDYVEGWWSPSGDSENDTISYVVISDTLLSNGKLYYKILPENLYFFKNYLRADTLGVYYYDVACEEEYLWYSYSLHVKDSTIINYCFSDSAGYPVVYKFLDTSSVILGTSRRYIKFENVFGIDAVYGIGLTPELGFTDYFVPTWDRNYYSYLLGCKISGITYGILTSLETEGLKDFDYKLEQNYPNPFNPSTKIKYAIPALSKGEETFVSLKVYDILGNEVATLVNEEQAPGVYENEFNSYSDEGQNLPSGIYFYQLRAGSFVETKKMLLLK